MPESESNPEWYYVGHYGQLGPLSFEQLTELADDGVIDQETYVWRAGMTEWVQASVAPGLQERFRAEGGPPPLSPYRDDATPPTFQPPSGGSGHGVVQGPGSTIGTQQTRVHQPFGGMNYGYTMVPKSDKSRITAGLLNILPGFGRFYLGYTAHGVFQLITSFCGVGLLWSWLDGLFMLVGGVKYDGYGRAIDD